MVGIMVCGHGMFGSGMISSAKIITGCKELVAVDYDVTQDNQDTLKEKMLDAYQQLGTEKLLVLCDVLGGTPFQVAVRTFFGKVESRILYGTNLGMIITACVENEKSLDEIVEKITTEGKMAIGEFKLIVQED